METTNFVIDINAPKEKVWNALWQDESYRKWTAPFSPTSYAVTDNWQKGSKILFLDDSGRGMFSTVVENKPNEYMSIKHLGEVKDGVEDTTSKTAQQWNGAMENYKLITTNNGTQLNIELIGDIPNEAKAYFMNAWPKALDTLKTIAEESN
jgi:hypothetical protein